MPTLIERRRFLRSVALASVGAPIVAATRPSGDPLEVDPGQVGFHHGVASGDPGPDRVTIWCRLGGLREATGSVHWKVARDPRLQEVVVEGRATATRAADGTVQVEATGLEPGTTYWYGFDADGQQSPAGRTKTVPAPGAERVRLAVLSCGNLEAGWFNAYRRVAERDDLDLVVHLGDYLYEYGDDPAGEPPVPGRSHQPRLELRTLDDYRRRYRQYRSDPDLQHLHARHPVLSLHDDHEVVNDAWAGGGRQHDAEDGDYRARRRGALQAWREWHPRSPASAPVWRGVDLGGLVDLALVDGRSHRPRLGSLDIEGHRDDGLGPRQRAWLHGHLAHTAAPWPLVCTQQPVFRRLDESGRAIGAAGWSGFAAAQADLLDAVRAAGGAIVSGDVHSSWLIEGDGFLEAIIPSVTSRSPADKHGLDVATAMDRSLRAANPAVSWIDLRSHGYLLVDATADRCRFEWWFVDAVEDRTGAERLGHAFEWRRR